MILNDPQHTDSTESPEVFEGDIQERCRAWADFSDDGIQQYPTINTVNNTENKGVIKKGVEQKHIT